MARRVLLLFLLASAWIPGVQAQDAPFIQRFDDGELYRWYLALKHRYAMVNGEFVPTDGEQVRRLAGTVKAFLDGNPMLFNATNGAGLVAVDVLDGSRWGEGEGLCFLGKPAGTYDKYLEGDVPKVLSRYQWVPCLTYPQFKTLLNNTQGAAFPEMHKAGEPVKSPTPAPEPVKPVPPPGPVKELWGRRVVLPDGRVAKLFDGKFFVNVNESATIYVNGKQVHSAAKGTSVSPDTTLKLDDLVVVRLSSPKGLGHFKLGFLSNDYRCLINFNKQSLRDMGNADVAAITKKEVEERRVWVHKVATEKAALKLPDDIPDHSEYVWGMQNECVVASVLATAQFTVPGR